MATTSDASMAVEHWAAWELHALKLCCLGRDLRAQQQGGGQPRE
jgi:hypothetical protein